MSLQVYQAKTVFDSPRYYPDGNYGPYYSMMIELPEGAPGTEYDDKYDRIYAYMSYDADHEDAEALERLSRGQEFTVVWTGQKYKPALGGASNGAAPQAVTTATTSTGNRPVIEPESKVLVELGYEQLAWETCDRILGVYSRVASDKRAEELSSDEKLRVAISGVIQANRDASRELPRIIEYVELQEIVGVDADELPNSLLSKIAELLPNKYESTEQVVSKLKELGLSSADIDKDDKDTWVQLYQIAKSVPAGEASVDDEQEGDDFEESDDLPPF